MAQRINKKALVDLLSNKDGFEGKYKYQIEDLVDVVIDTIQEQVIKGNDVVIPGFGKFTKFTRSNGAKAFKFRPSKSLKEATAA